MRISPDTNRSSFSSRLILPVLAMVLLASSTASAAEGIISVPSPHAVASTVDRLEAVLAEKRMTVFARINHRKGAASAGVSLRPTELIIFGNPKVGAPLMDCQQSVALDLPQKALVWQDAQGQVWLSYNDPRYLEQRHRITGCESLIAKIENALAGIAAAATRP